MPKPIKSSLVCAPVSGFCITPLNSLQEAQVKYDAACQTKAVTLALSAAGSGHSRSLRGYSRISVGSSSFRGLGRGSYLWGRGGFPDHTGRGSFGRVYKKRGAPRLSRRKQELFGRRDNWYRGGKKSRAESSQQGDPQSKL